MTSGLVNASFSLPEWQAVKMIFFAPWVQLIALFLSNETVMFCRPKIAQLGKDFVEIDPSWFFSTVDGVPKNNSTETSMRWGRGHKLTPL